MDDPEFPVRVQACLALTEMVVAYDSGGIFPIQFPSTVVLIWYISLVKAAVAPQVSKVIQSGSLSYAYDDKYLCMSDCGARARPSQAVG